MALTLIEAAKKNSGDVIRSAIIELYAMNSDILRVLPFKDIPGNAYKYNQEDTLPGIGFRGVNEAYSESTGVINPETESLVIAGGDLDVDNFITATMGEDQRASQEAMKVKALAHKWSEVFIKGDSVTNQAQFDGLQTRLTIGGSQVVDAGNSAGGDALSLAKLDETIDAVDDPNYLYMNKAMRRRLTAAARDESVGGHVNYMPDEFGRRVTQYNDLPILLSDRNGSAFPTLAFNEPAPNDGALTTTSIYVLWLGDGSLQGIQNGTIDVRDLGELETKPSARTRVEWFTSLLMEHSRAAARCRGISDAAVVK